MRCKTCLVELPVTAFYTSNKGRCMECVKAAVRENRLAKLAYYRSYDRQRASAPHRVALRAAYRETDAFRLSHAVASKKWDVANAIRKRAATAVSNAMRDGKLERQPCFLCGANAQAHHPDYAAPLAVTWLCSLHHSQLHAEHRQYLREAP